MGNDKRMQKKYMSHPDLGYPLYGLLSDQRWTEKVSQNIRNPHVAGVERRLHRQNAQRPAAYRKAGRTAERCDDGKDGGV